MEYSQKIATGKAFWVTDGTIVHSIYELAETLQHMKKEIFKYHVNKEKNDFSEWIRYVVGDEALADELARTLSKDKALTIVLRHILKKWKRKT